MSCIIKDPIDCPHCDGCGMVERNAYARPSITSRDLARRNELADALRKVRAHTGHLPGAPRELLVDLLKHIGEICDHALRGNTTP